MARRYFEQAAELADDPVARAGLLEQAGQMAWMAGSGQQASTHFLAAIELFGAVGLTHPAARVSARLGEVDWAAGRQEQALDRMQAGLAVLSTDEPDEDLATLAAQLGRLETFAGAFDAAAGHLELALQVAETLDLPEVLAEALVSKGSMLTFRRRGNEGQALMAHALKLALEHDLTSAALRAYANLAVTLGEYDRYGDAVDLFDEGLALARKLGNRLWEDRLLSEQIGILVLAGRWDEAVARAAEMSESEAGPSIVVSPVTWMAELHARRGELELAGELLARGAVLGDLSDLQDRVAHLASRAVVLQAQGRHAEAFDAAREALAGLEFGPGSQAVKVGLVEGLEAALALGELGQVEELLGTVGGLRPGELPPYLDAQATRFRARLAAARGQPDQAEAGFKAAAGLLRELGAVFWLAVTLLERGEWLATQDRAAAAAPLLEEAAAIFERLGAQPWVDRVRLSGAEQPACRPADSSASTHQRSSP